jgi:hypothetical protein
VRLGSPRFSFFVAQGAVIVASVLVALAADRIVMGLDDRALERSYLESLMEDLQVNEDMAEGAMRDAAARDSATVLVLRTLRGAETISGLSLAKALVQAGWIMELPFVRGTWDDMLGTGNLRILDDAEIREEVAHFYRRAEQIQAFTRDWVETAAEYQNIVRELMTPELRFAIGNDLAYRQHTVPAELEPDPRELAARMRAARGLEITLGDILLINRVGAEEHGDLVRLARDVQAMITVELGGPARAIPIDADRDSTPPIDADRDSTPSP